MEMSLSPRCHPSCMMLSGVPLWGCQESWASRQTVAPLKNKTKQKNPPRLLTRFPDSAQLSSLSSHFVLRGGVGPASQTRWPGRHCPAVHLPALAQAAVFLFPCLGASSHRLDLQILVAAGCHPTLSERAVPPSQVAEVPGVCSAYVGSQLLGVGGCMSVGQPADRSKKQRALSTTASISALSVCQPPCYQATLFSMMKSSKWRKTSPGRWLNLTSSWAVSLFSLIYAPPLSI